VKFNRKKDMAKKLLLDVLVKVLGEYVELDSDNLDVAVWSGNISLKDLKVNLLHEFTIKSLIMFFSLL
jgi:predicted RNA-binding protein associated with RNAse of E/G family